MHCDVHANIARACVKWQDGQDSSATSARFTRPAFRALLIDILMEPLPAYRFRWAAAGEIVDNALLDYDAQGASVNDRIFTFTHISRVLPTLVPAVREFGPEVWQYMEQRVQ